ncbi:MAG: hypothetical protein ACYCOU_03185 [Sulfobacillus sp.]
MEKEFTASYIGRNHVTSQKVVFDRKKILIKNVRDHLAEDIVVGPISVPEGICQGRLAVQYQIPKMSGLMVSVLSGDVQVCTREFQEQTTGNNSSELDFVKPAGSQLKIAFKLNRKQSYYLLGISLKLEPVLPDVPPEELRNAPDEHTEEPEEPEEQLVPLTEPVNLTDNDLNMTIIQEMLAQRQLLTEIADVQYQILEILQRVPVSAGCDFRTADAPQFPTSVELSPEGARAAENGLEVDADD